MPRIRSATDVGNVVRAARQRRRMTQHDLALAAGVSRRWIVALEAGKPRAELALVLTVLDALAVPLLADTPQAASLDGSSTALAPIDLDEHLQRLAGDS